jgi:hypothetical protein
LQRLRCPLQHATLNAYCLLRSAHVAGEIDPVGMSDFEKRLLKGGRAASGLRPELAALFDELVATSPPFSTRRSGVRLIREKLGIEYSHRTLERWPLPTQYVKGQATFPTAKMLEYVFAELNEAPVVMGGRATTQQQTA